MSDTNQVIERQTTGPTGLFQINGNTANRIGNDSKIISPVIRFYHNCDDDAKTKEKVFFTKLSNLFINK